MISKSRQKEIIREGIDNLTEWKKRLNSITSFINENDGKSNYQDYITLYKEEKEFFTKYISEMESDLSDLHKIDNIVVFASIAFFVFLILAIIFIPAG